MLAPRLKQRDGCAVGQVHGAAARQHGDAHTVGDQWMVGVLVGQARRFGAEEQRVAFDVFHLVEITGGLGGEGVGVGSVARR